MATDGANITEDAEMAECEEDKVVTMMDVLQEQQEFEDDANAVLGASDDKNCTYAKGYIKRQAIYACLTCCADSKTNPDKRAGVCLACSLMCHENHELVELYTKRNFRCDCGNSKFNSHPCQFTPNKPDLNEDNTYNQNFSGLYCICHRPYPDPEATREDDMIQCIICEDWLHASHLETVVPAHDQYSEMICMACMDKNEFLHDYSNLAINVESSDVAILTVNGAKCTNSLLNVDVTNENLTNNIVENNLETAAVISNGTDVDMTENKEKVEDESSKEKGNAESISNEETKQTTESDDPEVTEGKSDDNTTESKKEQESQLKEAHQEASDGAKKEDNVPTEGESTTENKEMPTEKELTPEQSDNTNNDNKMEKEDVGTNTTASNLVSGTQEQKNELNDHVANAAENKDDTNTNKDNADSNKTDDNVDGNKNDDQLLDDIHALTSDKPSDDVSKPSAEHTTTLSSEKATDEEKTEGSENDKSIEQIKESSTDQTTNDDSASKAEATSVSETANIEVPDTSQPKDAEMETSEDKTESVMDAIDELLKDPTETNKSDSIENENHSSEEMPASKENTDNSEIPKSDEVDISEGDSKLVPEETISSEKTNTDVEMTETKSEDVPSEDKTTVDSESSKTADDKETDCTTSNEQTSDTNSAESKMEADTKASIEDIEKEVNGDIKNENTTLNETDNKTVAEDEDSNKNEPVCDESKENEQSETTNEHKRKLSTELAEETSPKKIKLDKCCRPKNITKIFKGATFWPANFRQKLCTCGECICMYKDLNVLFLTDPEDPVAFYETLGKENVDGGASQYEKGLQALSSLDRIQQINALTEYNKMRDKLLDFLKSFKDRKEIVKEEDIKAFFAGMKPRREPDGVYFCR